MSQKNMPTILILGKINPRVVERLSGNFNLVNLDRPVLSDLDPDIVDQTVGIASYSVLPNSFIEGLPGLEIISNFGVGYDGIDAQFAAERNIMVCHTPEVLNDEVADVTIGLLLNTLRELPLAETYLREGRWNREGSFPLSRLTLRGRHVGIFGLGRIGLTVAKRLEGFDVKISYHSRNQKHGVDYQYYGSLLEMAGEIDTLISIVPGGANTENAINAEVLKALGPSGILINVGRGSTVDEPALISALKDKIIAGAGLDVFAEEPSVPSDLMSFPNVSLLPHVGSASVHTRDAMSDLVVDNLRLWFSDQPVLSAVPETQHVKRL